MIERYISEALKCIEFDVEYTWELLERLARAHDIELDWVARKFINSMEKLYNEKIKAI